MRKLERLAKVIVATQDRVRALDEDQLTRLVGLVKLLRLITDLRHKRSIRAVPSQTGPGDASEE